MGIKLACYQQKTVTTCLSLSNINKKLHLTVDKGSIPQEETPTYLGVKLDKLLTWNPHMKEMEKMAIPYGKKNKKPKKPLADTNWGASSSILRQVYTGNVRPVMEYGAAAWATAAKSNTSRLAKVRNKGMRIITWGL